MYVASAESFRLSPTTLKFEGEAAGMPGSFFSVDYPPGRRVGLHTHPYPELFLVQDGTAEFRGGDERRIVEGGSVVVVPAETPHGFANAGDTRLRVVSFHPSPTVIQTDLEDQV
jgi:quercetin dioxygenase-like cupin family protein